MTRLVVTAVYLGSVGVLVLLVAFWVAVLVAGCWGVALAVGLPRRSGS